MNFSFIEESLPLKKKSPRKKTPPKLSVKQDLLLDKLRIFYDNKVNITYLLDIINSSSNISLRIIDWFVTNYSKKNYVIIPVKKARCKNGEKLTNKTKKKDINYVDVDVNVFLNYKAQLKAYSKKYFDPFCRRERVSFKYNETDSILTTVGQLNFFKWAIENGIMDYIKDNLNIIEEDMNKNIKKAHSKSKKKKCSLDNKTIIVTDSSKKPYKPRNKRRELSTSAVKTLNKHSGNIILSFD
jgi:hypothetical protein